MSRPLFIVASCSSGLIVFESIFSGKETTQINWVREGIKWKRLKFFRILLQKCKRDYKNKDGYYDTFVKFCVTSFSKTIYENLSLGYILIIKSFYFSQKLKLTSNAFLSSGFDMSVPTAFCVHNFIKLFYGIDFASDT